MYAIIATGGKQYRVSEGDTLYVEKLPAEPGETVECREVLAVEKDGRLVAGTPFVEGARVILKVVRHGRGRKIIVFKYKPKKNYRRKKGHRQPFTQVVVEKIDVREVS
ncbi:50S ribosomal protein L21 [Desulfovirgula thermocuniculi]|uniref:50S ribosomal protein L21 n=1 Tax=Desulfovirgula thermocuniculi TaxID=348842 RepID=UPI0003FF2E3B|nr:50S ribosomal protein L21 [Desulfovirgula thermocuniculi]